MSGDTWWKWSSRPELALLGADLRAVSVCCHPHHLRERPLTTVPWPPEVKMSLIERRIRELLDHVRVRYTTGTHSDAKSRSARSFPVPRSTLRRAARCFRGAEKLSTFEPTRHRNRPKAFCTGVRPYERTPWPTWQPDRTNWCHGSPAEHAWSLLARGQPPSSPDGRGRPNRQSSPLMATFLMLSRSRGAIGRVRATPGALSYGWTDYGRPRRSDGRSPGAGKGF